MAVSDDHIFHLGSGTELSVEAAIGDLNRIQQFIHMELGSSFGTSANGFISDIGHVVELITQLQAGYKTQWTPPDDWFDKEPETQETSDKDIVIGRLQAAKWDANLARKGALSGARRDIYLQNIEVQLESALKMLKGEA